MTADKKEQSESSTSSTSFLVYLARFLAISSVVLVALNSFSYGTVFALHPISMTAAFVWLITEGILVAKSKVKTVADRNKKLDTHGSVQFGSLLLGALGFGSAFATKIQFGYPHFTSYHSYIGLAAFIGLFVVVACGMLIKNGIIKGAAARAGHRTFGGLVYLLGIAAVVIGLKTHFWISAAQAASIPYLDVAVPVAVCVVALCVLANK